MTTRADGFNRREFLTKTLSGVAGAGLLGVSSGVSAQTTEGESDKNSEKVILKRILGRTGIEFPIVNMGVMNAQLPALITKSYEIGVRHFDTAAWYQRGRNEEMLGNAIKELGVRDEVVIATKVYIPHDQRGMPPEEAKETFLRVADESLKRLQTDHVDILYSHNVMNLEYLNNPGIHEALQMLKEQGKTRFIGFTTHTNMTQCINEAAGSGFYDVIATAFNYAMADDQDLLKALKTAASKQIGLIAMKTQCAQYWYRQYVPESSQKHYEGNIMHTAVLKWALRNEFITTAIPGYTNFDQMREDFSVAYGLDYTPDEKSFLEDRNVRLSMGVCLQCNQCVSSCPNSVDIPTLMRAHLYATCYANPYEARDAMDSIHPRRDVRKCVSCKTCGATCSHNIDIARRIEDLKTI